MSTVCLLLIDGTRPDAITAERCPNLTALCQRGASTLSASSLMPYITLPCHMSIFHSVPPTRHGVTSNEWQPMARPLPGLVDLAAAAGKKCAFFYSWEQLRNLSLAGNLHHAFFRNNGFVRDGDHANVRQAIDYLAAEQPDFLFMYFGTVDDAGHRYGWMSPGYLDQVAHVDEAAGWLLQALPSNATVLFQSDHGGHERNHGNDIPEDRLIPWVIAGPGVRPNHTLTSPVSLIDTAPTLARFLQLTPHRDWEGRCIDEIFAD